MTPAQEFEALMAQYERNSNIGSLKSANITLAKILRLMWAQMAAGPADPAADSGASDLAYFTSKLTSGLARETPTVTNEMKRERWAKTASLLGIDDPSPPQAPPAPPVEAAKMPDEPVVDEPVVDEPSAAIEAPPVAAPDAPEDPAADEAEDAPKPKRGRR